MELKTCFFCKRCSLNLGGAGYSEYTPGYSGEISCDKGHLGDIDDEGYQELGFFVTQATNCPDFELHESIVEKMKKDD